MNEDKPVRRYELTWNGKDDHGQQIASGVYLYWIEAQGIVMMRKMVLLQ